MPRLVLLSEGLTGRNYELKAEKTTVGRVSDNAFEIPEASVSSHHAELTLRGNDVLVKDLGSTNGTFINGEKIEEAVLQEFERINDRGGVLGAMETQYQRSRIQEESLTYETKKHDGSLPIVGVNTYLNPAAIAADEARAVTTIELERPILDPMATVVVVEFDGDRVQR